MPGGACNCRVLVVSSGPGLFQDRSSLEQDASLFRLTGELLVNCCWIGGHGGSSSSSSSSSSSHGGASGGGSRGRGLFLQWDLHMIFRCKVQQTTTTSSLLFSLSLLPLSPLSPPSFYLLPSLSSTPFKFVRVNYLSNCFVYYHFVLLALTPIRMPSRPGPAIACRAPARLFSAISRRRRHRSLPSSVASSRREQWRPNGQQQH